MIKEITPKDPFLFGGVKVNRNEVASTRTVKENGKTQFIVNFKNGSTIKYPHQPIKQGAHIENGKYTPSGPGRIFREPDVQEVNITNIYGAKFMGSNKRDQISLNGCNNCTIDVSNDKTTDEVVIKDSSFKSQHNTIKQGSYDCTFIHTKGRDYDTGIIVSGEGTHKEGNE